MYAWFIMNTKASIMRRQYKFYYYKHQCMQHTDSRVVNKLEFEKNNNNNSNDSCIVESKEFHRTFLCVVCYLIEKPT